jgi:hypothetical protein
LVIFIALVAWPGAVGGYGYADVDG